MRTNATHFGAICLLASILAIYGLLFFKLYVFWTKGVWSDWAAGNFMPDALIRGVFSLKPSLARDALVWVLSLDVILYLLPFPLLIYWLDRFARDAN